MKEREMVRKRAVVSAMLLVMVATSAAECKDTAGSGDSKKGGGKGETIKYVVVGSAERIDISWRDSYGKWQTDYGAKQPWVTKEFLDPEKTVHYLEIWSQIKTAGTSRCTIYVNGVIVDTNKAVGAGRIAKCRQTWVRKKHAKRK